MLLIDLMSKSIAPQMGEPSRAVAAFGVAYRLFRQLGQDQYTSTVWQELGKQGQRYVEEKKFVEALELYSLQVEVLVVYFADHSLANWVSIDLGRVYYSQGQFTKAIASRT